MVTVSAYLEYAVENKQRFCMSIIDRALSILDMQGCRNGESVSSRFFVFFFKKTFNLGKIETFFSTYLVLA
jgi:hypothetical protein